MRSFLKSLIVVILLIFMEHIHGTASADELGLWQLRGVAELPSDIRIKLAKSSLPLWRTIKSDGGSTLSSIVSEVCGIQPAAVQTFLLEEALRLNRINSVTEPIEKEVAVAIPFCLKVERNVSITVKEGDTLEKIMNENYGVSGPRTLERLLKLNANKFKVESLKELAPNLQVGDQVTIPWASTARVFAPRPDFETSLPELLQQSDLQSVSPQINNSLTPVESSPDRDAYQFSFVDSVEYENSSEKCGESGGPAFIVDLDLLEKRFTFEEGAKKNADGNLAQQITIGIIDSGLAEVGDTFFRKEFFAPNLGELDKEPDKDDDDNNFVDDVFGINFNGPRPNGWIKPFATSGKMKSHGTKMAALVLGGPAVVTGWTGVRPKPPIRLKIVNFASSTQIEANVGAENLAGAIGYLAEQGAQIINMSLANGQNTLSVSQAIGIDRNQLFVVAAGNAKQGPGRNLEFAPLVFPARYGGSRGDHHRNVVTVAAHDLTGRIANFSNYSTEFVDLLAPGCAVETRDDSGNTVLDDGTSSATAIVSFASGLVASLGIARPKQIKNRLLISTDFDPSLQKTSWSSGRLNILKAISLRSDVVQLDSSEFIFGRIADRVTLNKFCGDEVLRAQLNDVRKIVPNISTPQGLEIEYWIEADSLLKRVRCKQSPIGMGENIGAIDGNVGPNIANIRDIIFASF